MIILGDDYGKDFNVNKTRFNYLSNNKVVCAS